MCVVAINSAPSVDQQNAPGALLPSLGRCHVVEGRTRRYVVTTMVAIGHEDEDVDGLPWWCLEGVRQGGVVGSRDGARDVGLVTPRPVSCSLEGRPIAE